MKTTLQEWKEFKKTSIYLDLIDEFQERYDIVLSSLIKGKDDCWSDENMRGRLSEIEYIQGIVDAIITDLEIEIKNKDKKSFIETIIDKFKPHED